MTSISLLHLIYIIFTNQKYLSVKIQQIHITMWFHFHICETNFNKYLQYNYTLTSTCLLHFLVKPCDIVKECDIVKPCDIVKECDIVNILAICLAVPHLIQNYSLH